MISIVMATDGGKSTFEDDDKTGDDTIGVLKRVRDLVHVINGNVAGSLGLHPAVYFYSQEGRFKSSAFLGMIKFIGEIAKRKKLDDFTRARKRFESFVLSYDYVTQQINRKLRTADTSYPFIARFFQLAMESILSGNTDAKTLSSIRKEADFSYLNTARPVLSVEGRSGERFNSDKKSEVFIRSALAAIPRCAICSGHLHLNSITTDHKTRRRDGGAATVSNGQLAHPYCNTGFKA